MNKPTVLITGACQGIGLEIATELAQRDCVVWLTARDSERGRTAADNLTGDVRFLRIDVTDVDSILDAADCVERVDVLINNAAVLLDADVSILELPLQTVRETLEANTLGPLRMAQAFVPRMRHSHRPRIINVSSGGGQLSEPSTWAPAYCLSKTALNSVTVQLATALPEFAVNAVCPGWVRTSMGGSGAPRSVGEGADTVVWLATEAPQYLTGKFLRDREIIPW